MDLALNGRIAIVTGASSGIGRGICDAMAAEGVQVVAAARRGKRLNEVAQQISEQGHLRPLTVEVDLRETGGPAHVVERALNELGRVDIVVNNAGGSIRIPSPASPTADVEANERDWMESFTLQFNAVRRLSDLLLPIMVSHQWGRIINTGGTLEPPDVVNGSTVAKAAVAAWAKGLSHEVGPFGITVNTIIPGRIMSEQIRRMHPTAADREAFSAKNIPIRRFGEPTEIGGLVAFLCSPHADYITGAVLHVDGGLRRYAF